MVATTSSPQQQIAPPELKTSFPWGMILRFTVLTALALFMILPFIWQAFTSMKTNTEVNAALWPHTWKWDNYASVFSEVHFARYYLNSIMIAVWCTILTIATSAMAAFSFARLRWKGRETVFILYLATMMIPGVVLMIPQFWIMMQLHWYNSYLGLIVPGAFSAFGTFLLRQFMLGLPRSLDEAAEIDGASEWQVFTEVILPLTRPGLITLAIFTFFGAYSSFFWPLIMVKDDSLRTLPLGLLEFTTEHGTDTVCLMAAAVMSIVPLILIFVFFQKYLVKGIQLGAVKG
jgi:ABC-type glycerol-3-phosphate transport system permease component